MLKISEGADHWEIDYEDSHNGVARIELKGEPTCDYSKKWIESKVKKIMKKYCSDVKYDFSVSVEQDDFITIEVQVEQLIVHRSSVKRVCRGTAVAVESFHSTCAVSVPCVLEPK